MLNALLALFQIVIRQDDRNVFMSVVIVEKSTLRNKYSKLVSLSVLLVASIQYEY